MSVASLHRETAFQARSLFRSLLRHSGQFSNYNFREYARRKTKDSFREHQNTSEERQIQELIQEGLQSLRLLKRQTVISQFFQLDKLVVEGQKTGKETGNHGGIVRQKDTGASRSGRHLDGAPNRTRTGQIDHDVFEGLPVRRWSRQQHTFSQAAKPDDSEFGVQGPGGGPILPELPMPRDSQILPPMSRALLRAARAGCIHIRQGSRPTDDEEKSVVDAEDSAAASHMADRSFTTRKWMTLPKHLEPAEVEFLAKRRPGLPSLYGATAGTDGSSGAGSGPMRRTKFKKTDPETGNISIYEAWVPEGHRIEGEITGDLQTIVEQSQVSVKPEAPAPGTVVEGVGIVNAEGVVVAEAGSAAVMTPPKRRPPPPKRKGRGIGKGRKKKVMFAPGEGADAAAVHGVGPASGTSANGVKGEGQHDGSQMSIDQAGQDEDDEDGDEGDDSDEGDESMIDAKTPDTPQPLSGTESVGRSSFEPSAEQSMDVDMADAIPENQASASEPILLAKKETTTQEQAIVAEAAQLKHSTEADSSVPSEKADATDFKEKPVITGIDETPVSSDKSGTMTSKHTDFTTTAEEAHNSSINLQKKDEATEPMAELRQNEEPNLASEQKNAIDLPPASPKEYSEPPLLQSLNHPQPAEQPLGGVSASEQTTVSSNASIEVQESKQTSNESPSNLDARDRLSVAAEHEQTKPSGIFEASPDSTEAKDVDMEDAPASEPSPARNTQSLATQDSPQAPPLSAHNPQIEPTSADATTAVEVPGVNNDTAADPSLPEEPKTIPDERTEATSEIDGPDKTVDTGAHVEENSHPGEAKEIDENRAAPTSDPTGWSV
ncbi:LYR family protein [Penicillium paradoxum]|uniref:LYR family protein n=1 Tax=Penicillium paradoxum TaxID=176176 RepID=UPI002548E142|nr:LYR family protein [Penicillium paradoxum]KAJ5780959.1 LYR family protein [Penicillium paradoxum]